MSKKVSKKKTVKKNASVKLKRKKRQAPTTCPCLTIEKFLNWLLNDTEYFIAEPCKNGEGVDDHLVAADISFKQLLFLYFNRNKSSAAADTVRAKT